MWRCFYELERDKNKHDRVSDRAALVGELFLKETFENFAVKKPPPPLLHHELSGALRTKLLFDFCLIGIRVGFPQRGPTGNRKANLSTASERWITYDVARHALSLNARHSSVLICDVGCNSISFIHKTMMPAAAAVVAQCWVQCVEYSRLRSTIENTKLQ